MSPAVVLIALFAILLVVFQFFVRYDYVRRGHVIWRVDRLTRQVCQVVTGVQLDCSGKHSASLSTSPSLSISTSTAVGRVAHSPRR